jgi:hypothetical protein
MSNTIKTVKNIFYSKDNLRYLYGIIRQTNKELSVNDFMNDVINWDGTNVDKYVVENDLYSLNSYFISCFTQIKKEPTRPLDRVSRLDKMRRDTNKDEYNPPNIPTLNVQPRYIKLPSTNPLLQIEDNEYELEYKNHRNIILPDSKKDFDY